MTLKAQLTLTGTLSELAEVLIFLRSQETGLSAKIKRIQDAHPNAVETVIRQSLVERAPDWVDDGGTETPGEAAETAEPTDWTSVDVRRLFDLLPESAQAMLVELAQKPEGYNTRLLTRNTGWDMQSRAQDIVRINRSARMVAAQAAEEGRAIVNPLRRANGKYVMRISFADRVRRLALFRQKADILVGSRFET